MPVDENTSFHRSRRTEPPVEVDGQLQSIKVSDELFQDILLSIDPFYYCKDVGDGYRRCRRLSVVGCQLSLLLSPARAALVEGIQQNQLL